MLVTNGTPPVTYVGPFDRICRGLRNYNPATTDSKEACLLV